MRRSKPFVLKALPTNPPIPATHTSTNSTACVDCFNLWGCSSGMERAESISWGYSKEDRDEALYLLLAINKRKISRLVLELYRHE